jgi:N-ethylmaleimide reductase
MPSLFDPLAAGDLKLPNRIFMAPLTRGRAGESRVPNEMMARYYAQRADAGLIVAEATAISKEGYGWKNAPAMYTDEQEAGWKIVTDAVHEAGGRIALQLWHMGRVSHPYFQENNALPLAPSAIAAEGFARGLGSANAPYVTPKAMTKKDIRRTVGDYERAAQRAKRAGFDAVEIHGANGYLIDEFLRDGSNVRTDDYGGSVENRARFLREVIEAVAGVMGAGRTGLRLSPVNGYNSMQESDLLNTFVKVAEIVSGYGLAWLHVKEPVRDADGKAVEPVVTKAMREVYKGVLAVNEAYDSARAEEEIESGLADAVAFGKPFIANPDLVERLRTGAELNAPDMATFYTPGERGYLDYPALDEIRRTPARA